MIPILYDGIEQSFTSNGLGRLADAITCKVVEERNATYELEMTYPVTGIHFDDIQEGRIILAQPFDGGLTQPFTIYQITKPLNQVVTVKAQHISYQLSGIVVMPYEANSCLSALAGIDSYSSTTNPFNFTTDKQVTAHYEVTTPTSARALLCGQSGSILDVYGKGDYEFNRYDVNLWTNRGADNGVTLRYGKNITDLKNVVDITNVYTGIVPYWIDGEGNTVVLPEKVVLSGHEGDYPFKIIKSVDFSSNWETQPTVEQLRTAAQNYVTNNEGWKLKNNITISFVALWNTEEYKNIAPLERVKMCDVVHVVVPKLGIDFDTKVIKTDYNVLQERYNSITLGDSYYSLSAVFSEEITRSEEQQSTHMQQAIARATKLIQGGLGGHVVFNVNADGEPQEILIMDTDDIQTAVSVIRMNKNGIGFSTNGYNGPFHTAWTIDGHFVADYIDTGTLDADLIKAGRIQDNAGNNYWDMVTGDFQLSARAIVGNSTVASKQDVSTGDASTLASANANTANAISNYDTYTLTQTKVFNKLTNNGQLQGIYMQNGNLYINSSYIATGILADAYGNTKWNLQTGKLESKKLSIDSTYFQLSEAGAITSISQDGKKIVVDKGTITGYKSNGDLSAKLEIGDGYFNIANGVLAIQGVVGVSGRTDFVKSLNYEDFDLGQVQGSTAIIPTAVSSSSSSVRGNISVSGQTTMGALANFSGTCVVDGKAGTCSGTVSIPSMTVSGGMVMHSLTADAQRLNIQNSAVYTEKFSISQQAAGLNGVVKAVKAVAATTGSINSQYGIIQSIS